MFMSQHREVYVLSFLSLQIQNQLHSMSSVGVTSYNMTKCEAMGASAYKYVVEHWCSCGIYHYCMQSICDVFPFLLFYYWPHDFLHTILFFILNFTHTPLVNMLVYIDVDSKLSVCNP